MRRTGRDTTATSRLLGQTARATADEAAAALGHTARGVWRAHPVLPAVRTKFGRTRDLSAYDRHRRGAPGEGVWQSADPFRARIHCRVRRDRRARRDLRASAVESRQASPDVFAQRTHKHARGVWRYTMTSPGESMRAHIAQQVLVSTGVRHHSARSSRSGGHASARREPRPSAYAAFPAV
jgi:hypothetical protein